nr:hypothetical protein [Tanacetum cinerariifolium]
MYKVLVDAYECDKIILDTYGDTVTLKRRRDDADKDEEPSIGSDRGFKIRREGKEPESTSAPKEKASKTIGVESYQKKLNITKPDTYMTDLKRKKAYTAYSNPRGFIYQNKDKQNRLMRIDESHKFSDDTLNDVRTALDDRLKAKDEEDHAKSGKVCWREVVRGRLQGATTDHMIYHMMFLSYKERFNTTARNLVKEILLKLNLPDHRSILTDLQVTPTKPGRMTKPYSSHRFIANCFNAGNSNMEVKTVHMIMASKDNLYNGRKGIGFENPSYFKKAKDLRPTLYDEKVIGLGYTLMFLTYSDEDLEIKMFKRSRENKIEFAYDYGNLNASYVNEKIHLEDDYFQEIINPDFDKIDSLF